MGRPLIAERREGVVLCSFCSFSTFVGLRLRKSYCGEGWRWCNAGVRALQPAGHLQVQRVRFGVLLQRSVPGRGVEARPQGRVRGAASSADGRGRAVVAAEQVGRGPATAPGAQRAAREVAGQAGARERAGGARSRELRLLGLRRGEPGQHVLCELCAAGADEHDAAAAVAAVARARAELLREEAGLLPAVRRDGVGRAGVQHVGRLLCAAAGHSAAPARLWRGLSPGAAERRGRVLLRRGERDADGAGWGRQGDARRGADHAHFAGVWRLQVPPAVLRDVQDQDCAQVV